MRIGSVQHAAFNTSSKPNVTLIVAMGSGRTRAQIELSLSRRPRPK